MGYEVSNMKSPSSSSPLLAQLPPPSSHLPTGTPQLQARLSSSSSKLLGEATANLLSQHGTNLWPSSTDTHQPLLAMLAAPQLASHFAIPTASADSLPSSTATQTTSRTTREAATSTLSANSLRRTLSQCAPHPTLTSAMPPKRLRSKSSRPCLLTSSPLPLLARTRRPLLRRSRSPASAS